MADMIGMYLLIYTHGRRNRGGGTGRDLPSGSHKFHFLGGTGGTQYISKMSPFYFSLIVFQQFQ